jgi:hypothetical protein
MVGNHMITTFQVKVLWGQMSDWIDIHMEHNVSYSVTKASIKITCLDCLSTYGNK